MTKIEPRKNLRFPIQESQTIITVFYLMLVGIGMLFKHQKFSQFGINIFEYADLFDFLVAPFSDPYIIYYTVGIILFVLLMYKFDSLTKKKLPRIYSILSLGIDKKSWFNVFRIVMLSVSVLAYLYVSAVLYGNHTREKIERTSQTTIMLTDNTEIKGKVIGKTKDMIFLLHKTNVVAIPVMNAVKQINL